MEILIAVGIIIFVAYKLKGESIDSEPTLRVGSFHTSPVSSSDDRTSYEEKPEDITDVTCGCVWRWRGDSHKRVKWCSECLSAEKKMRAIERQFK